MRRGQHWYENSHQQSDLEEAGESFDSHLAGSHQRVKKLYYAGEFPIRTDES